MSVRTYRNSIRTNIDGIATATAPGIIIQPIDISDYEHFSITYRNCNTAIGFLNMQVQVAHVLETSATDTAPSWIELPTTTISVPSALGPTAIAVTSQVQNTWNYLRVLGHTSQTATADTFVVVVGGF